MKILALHDGHNATACFLRDDEVVSLVSEERFTGIKNQGGFPENALRWIMQTNSLTPDDVDLLVFPHLIAPVEFFSGPEVHNSSRHALFNLISTLFPNRVIGSRKIVPPYLAIFGRPRRRAILAHGRRLGFADEKLRQVEHHDAHGYAALYSSGFTLGQKGDEPVLVFSLDNSGDGFSSRVSIWDKDKGLNTLQETSTFHSLGELFYRVTQYMGMKGSEDEYKLMGMAPYVSDEKSLGCFKKFLKYIDLDEQGNFVNHKTYGIGLLKHLQRDFFRERFDSISAGIQRHFEYVVTMWVKHWAARTGIRKAVFGGGCFMNVKCNMLLTELDELDKLYFCPSSGDESCSLGAAYFAAVQAGEDKIQPLDSLYKGPAFTEEEIKAALEKFGDKIQWNRLDDIEQKVAELLHEGKIVARFKGASEWGARALGSRSILCRADDLKIIHRLNRFIKNRDFWMPFASSILAEDSARYVDNPKNVDASNMTITFRTTSEAKAHIAAGLHPFDSTCRPQLVKKEATPDYHRLLTLFKDMTGYSGLLNTSFNLHGEPMVGTPEAAIRTLVNSGLDFLAIENFLVSQKGEPG